MTTVFLIALYVVGIVVTFVLMKDWSDHNLFVKCVWSLIWPLVAILYGIYWLHKKL